MRGPRFLEGQMVYILLREIKDSFPFFIFLHCEGAQHSQNFGFINDVDK